MGFLVKTFKACVCGVIAAKKNPRAQRRGSLFGGARRNRTDDLLHAMQALSQLSYGPETLYDAGGIGTPPFRERGRYPRL